MQRFSCTQCEATPYNLQLPLMTEDPDQPPALAAEIEDYLKEAAAKGLVCYRAHRQDAATMTCFTPSPVNPSHLHFIDGAQGDYALAAAALKGG
jgi:DUF3095 family protein